MTKQKLMKWTDKLKQKAKSLEVELTAVYFAMKDKRTPFVTKLLIALTVSYALSPIDLIPDFIPVLGYLDDLIIVPLLITLSMKMIPSEVMQECKLRAQNEMITNKIIGIWSAVAIILIWVALIIWIILKIWK